MGAGLEREIQSSLRDGKLPCEAAWQIAARAEVEKIAVGEMADALEVRVNHCQLGLFGYGEKRLGQHKIVRPAESVRPDIASALKQAAQGGAVTCAQAFEIAERLSQLPMVVSAQAESLGFRIVQCQLGCFP
jgi:hypothetical protein